MTKPHLTTIYLDIFIVAVKINWYLDKGMKIIMLPNRVLTRIVFCSESTFVLGPIPPDNKSSAGSLYEYEPCNTKQKLHYLKTKTTQKQIRGRGDKTLLNSRALTNSRKTH